MQSASIRSRHNRRFRDWKRMICDPSDPDCPWLPVEGTRQILDLARLRPIQLLLYAGQEPSDSVGEAREAIRLPGKLLAELSRVRNSQGMIAFFEKPRFSETDLTSAVLYLDELQDPGNVGTLLRTAAATGRFSLITSRNTVSCFNTKVLRASAGFLFSVPVVEGLSLDRVAKLGYRIYVAVNEAGESLFETEMREPLAFVLGNEGRGVVGDLPPQARRVNIPMPGGTESLNAAVAGSLLMYELVRRR